MRVDLFSLNGNKSSVYPAETLTGRQLDVRIRELRDRPDKLALLVADVQSGKTRVVDLTARQARALVPGASYGYSHTAARLSSAERLNIDRGLQTLSDVHLGRRPKKLQQIEWLVSKYPDAVWRAIERYTAAQHPQAAE